MFSLNSAISKNFGLSKNFIDALYAQAKKDLDAGKSLTQSQAHLLSTVTVGGKKPKSVSERDRVIEKYGKYKNWIMPNKVLIQKVFDRERAFRDSGKKYYVFYTAAPYMHLMQDLAKNLYEYNYGKEGSLQSSEFQFLRYFHHDPFFDQYKNITEFLNTEIKQNGIVDDNILKIKIVLLSLNLSIFGNIGLTGESTFFYFNQPQKWVSLSPMFIEDSLNSYGFLNVADYSQKFLNIIKSDLGYDVEPTSMDDSKTGADFFQIFVPEELVDKIAYKSWRQGFPFDVALLQKLFPDKLKDVSTLDDSKLITSVDIKDAIQRIQTGAISGISGYLQDFISNSTFSLKSYIDQEYITEKDSLMNFVQARILITNDIFLNPAAGIKIFRYTSVPASNLKNYKVDFNSTFNDLTSKQPKAESQFDARLISKLIRINNLLEMQDPIKQFTQTQALLNIHAISEKIKQFARAAYKNEKIVFKILDREKQYAKDYYVFYTAIPYMRLFQDVINFLYKKLQKNTESLQQNEFIFLRYDLNNKIYDEYKDVNQFLVSTLKKYCIIDDRFGSQIKSLLLSTNVSLFGNVDLVGESTWGFFNNPQVWVALNKIYLENILESFGFSKDLSDKIMSHYNELKDSNNDVPADLIQIFIPKSFIDDIVYICWTRGIPFDVNYIKGVCTFLGFVPGHVKQIFGSEPFKNIPTTKSGSMKDLVVQVQSRCKSDFPKNIVSSLITNIGNGNFNPSILLSSSNLTSDYQYYQGRILFTNDKMLNPESGIKMFRYSQLTPAQEQEYNQALESHLNEILSEQSRIKPSQPTTSVDKIISQCLTRSSKPTISVETIISQCLNANP